MLAWCHICKLVPVVALTATLTEQTKCYISNSLVIMVDPEIIAVNPNRQNIFYTCSTRPHTSDNKIKELLLVYIAKLQVMSEDDATDSNLHPVIVDMYVDNIFGNLTSSNIPWLMIFLILMTCLLENVLLQ